MRARAGVAQWAWMLGDRDRAIAIYTDMLILNPNDNQGVRYLLASALLEDRTALSQRALGRLLTAFEQEHTTALIYSRALLLFQIQDNSLARANRVLREGLQANSHVPALLLGEQAMPEQTSPFVGSGDLSEAAEYVSTAYDAWRQTSGALFWLREQRSSRRPRARSLYRGEKRSGAKNRNNDAYVDKHRQDEDARSRSPDRSHPQLGWKPPYQTRGDAVSQTSCLEQPPNTYKRYGCSCA